MSFHANHLSVQMNTLDSILDAVGNTPMVKLHQSLHNTDNTLFAKLEYFNPTMSMKDRIAKGIILDCEEKGLLKPNCTIVAPSSGNFGIALSFVCAIKGYKLKVVMSEAMSVERRKLIAYYGAEIVLTDKHKGSAGTIAKAREMVNENPEIFLIDQNANPINFFVNRDILGNEIFQQTQGKIDTVICGAGTGGCISGIAAFLKSKKSDVYAIAVEPEGSNIFSGGNIYIPSELQGMGAHEMPATFRSEYVDKVESANKMQAFMAARDLGKMSGIRGGISSGASFHVARSYAKTVSGKNICFIVPDACDRYFSTELIDIK